MTSSNRYLSTADSRSGVFVPLWVEVVYVLRNGEAPTPGPSIYRRAVTKDASIDDKHLECVACLEPMVAAVTVAPCGHSCDLRCLSHHWHMQADAGRPLGCLAGGCTAPPESSRANEELRRLVEAGGDPGRAAGGAGRRTSGREGQPLAGWLGARAGPCARPSSSSESSFSG